MQRGTGDILLNLTGRNISDYLVKTYPQLIRQGWVLGTEPSCVRGHWGNKRAFGTGCDPRGAGWDVGDQAQPRLALPAGCPRWWQ